MSQLRSRSARSSSVSFIEIWCIAKPLNSIRSTLFPKYGMFTVNETKLRQSQIIPRNLFGTVKPISKEIAETNYTTESLTSAQGQAPPTRKVNDREIRKIDQ
jgi:hypothetical protein